MTGPPTGRRWFLAPVRFIRWGVDALIERRAVLSAGSAALVGGVLAGGPLGWVSGPARAAEAGGPGTSFEQRLAAFSEGVRYDALPPEVIDAAKRVLLDTLGCALGSVGSDPARIAEGTIRSTFGSGDAATIIGYPERATIEGAVFVNGVLVRNLDLNDTYLGTEPLHPSEVLPTALAICEAGGLSGRALIEAIVVGYESSARVTDAISFIQRGFHPLCAMSYAVPLMAGRLWGLAPEAVAHAVGLSAARGYTSFVVNSGAISMMKAMGLAATAVDGIFATRLAAKGFTGPSGTLEWFAAKSAPRLAEISVDLDTVRYRLPRVAFKRYPVQIELAAVAEAGSLLSERVKGRAGAIREIVVETYPGIIERVADAPKFRPETKGTADHSLPVCLALALLDGDVTVAQFERDRWRDGDVMGLVGKTSVKPGAALMARFPKGRGATVEVVFSEGPSLRATVEVPEGDPERPLSRASLEHKFLGFATPVLGAAGAERVMAMVEGVEAVGDVRALTALLKGPGRAAPT